MRLLLIEDDPMLSTRLKTALQSVGYTIDAVDTGSDGEFLAGEIDYDSVILDLGLPDCSGLAVLRNWRDAAMQVPVLILTARDDWQDKVDGFKAGADDYLCKPFHIEELEARLNVLVRRSKRQPIGCALSVGGLELDESTQSVVGSDGQTIALTMIEFRLLRCLMLHPGRLMSKAQLLERVYDLDSDKDSNVLEVYITRLRQKIGRECIVTRRGQGYIFSPEQPR